MNFCNMSPQETVDYFTDCEWGKHYEDDKRERVLTRGDVYRHVEPIGRLFLLDFYYLLGSIEIKSSNLPLALRGNCA